jgi:hypothetical protein
LKDPDARKAAQAAVSYVQLVFGRQLQRPDDEVQPAGDPLSIASMPRAERDHLARELAAQHPALARRILGEDVAKQTMPQQ